MKDLPETIRAFIAVRIPDEVMARLVSVQKQLRRELEDVSWTRPEAMHVTLQFLGNVESARLAELEAALREAATSTAPFGVELAGLGSFSHRVLWAGIVGGAEQLTTLANTLRSAAKGLAGHEEERAFSAHVTLGRCRRPMPGIARTLQLAGTPQFGGWRVEHFELIRSELLPQGARYTTLRVFPFGTA